MSYIQLLTHIMHKEITNSHSTIITTNETSKHRKIKIYPKRAIPPDYVLVASQILTKVVVDIDLQ